jgi:hypothetical protein
MIKNENIKIGDHCWALSNNKLIVVLKTTDSVYALCGYWERSVTVEELNIISIIKKPAGHEKTKLFYGG